MKPSLICVGEGGSMNRTTETLFLRLDPTLARTVRDQAKAATPPSAPWRKKRSKPTSMTPPAPTTGPSRFRSPKKPCSPASKTASTVSFPTSAASTPRKPWKRPRPWNWSSRSCPRPQRRAAAGHPHQRRSTGGPQADFCPRPLVHPHPPGRGGPAGHPGEGDSPAHRRHQPA